MTYKEENEKYIHFVSCIQNLNNAWEILQDIKVQDCSSVIVSAAFQFALIEYSKPYGNSVGTILNSKSKPIKYRLDEKHIPFRHIQLHKRILNARNKIYAHSDLTVMEAKLYVKNTLQGNIVSIVQNKIYGTEELANIDMIIELIEQTLDSMYIEVKLLQQQLSSDT